MEMMPKSTKRSPRRGESRRHPPRSRRPAPPEAEVRRSSTSGSEAASANSREADREVRILVVEDDDGSREALSLLLADSGYKVESAATVSEALDHLSPPPGWIISDLMLPDLAGEALIQEIRRRRLPCRILVITGVRDERRLEELERLNPEAVLTKPVSLGKILDELAPEEEEE